MLNLHNCEEGTLDGVMSGFQGGIYVLVWFFLFSFIAFNHIRQVCCDSIDTFYLYRVIFKIQNPKKKKKKGDFNK